MKYLQAKVRKVENFSRDFCEFSQLKRQKKRLIVWRKISILKRSLPKTLHFSVLSWILCKSQE